MSGTNIAILGGDSATINLNGYTAFNLPTSVEKRASPGGAVTASAEFHYDALIYQTHQRIRQIKRAGAVGSGAFVDDIVYVSPGGFEVHLDVNGKVIKSIATISGPLGAAATVSTQYDPATGVALAGQLNATALSSTTAVTGCWKLRHLHQLHRQ